MSVSFMYLYKINTLNLEQELSKKEKGINDFLDSKVMKTGKGPIQLICGIAKYFKEDSYKLFDKKEVDVIDFKLCAR